MLFEKELEELKNVGSMFVEACANLATVATETADREVAIIRAAAARLSDTQRVQMAVYDMAESMVDRMAEVQDNLQVSTDRNIVVLDNIDNMEDELCAVEEVEEDGE